MNSEFFLLAKTAFLNDVTKIYVIIMYYGASGVARGVRGGAVRTGRHLPGAANGRKIVKEKKTYTHANSDYLFLLAYEEQKNSYR